MEQLLYGENDQIHEMNTLEKSDTSAVSIYAICVHTYLQLVTYWYASIQ